MIDNKVSKNELDKNTFFQNQRIQASYNNLKEERVVTSKDTAFKWIIEIGSNYDGARSIGELMAVIDELIAYAILGKECID